MTYTRASGKSDRDVVSYTSVRGAEIKQINEAINEGTSISQLHKSFVRPQGEDTKTSTVDDTLSLLHALDFVERPSERTVEPISNQPFSDLSFELRFCHHLMEQEGDQNHFMEMHRLLAKQDSVFIDKEEFEEDIERNLDRYPFDWKVKKVENWYNMLDPLGIVSTHNNQKILTGASPRCVYDLLKAFKQREGSASFREALDWIEDEFFYCYVDRGGASPRVHAGLDQTLSTLIYHDVIELSTVSDAKQGVNVPSFDASQTSTFSVNEPPVAPSYEYPLESHNSEVSR